MSHTTTTNFEEAVKRLSNRRLTDKSSLHYIIKIVNHGKYFYSYEEWYKRDEWLTRLIAEIKTAEGWAKLVKLNSFKDLA